MNVCLSSLRETNYLYYELVVSDCLTPGIESWIKNNFSQIKLITFNEDIGPAASRNAGLRISNPCSKYVVFVDNDVQVHPNWLLNLVSYLEVQPDVGAAQPLLLKKHATNKIDSLGGFFDRIGYAYVCPFVFNEDFSGIGYFNICYCEAITIVRRSVLPLLGSIAEPYDAQYFQHWEDVDLCWRIMLSGFHVVLVPNAIVFHERGVSSGLGKQSDGLVFLNTRNRLMTLIKNYELKNLFLYVPVLLMFESVKIVVLLRSKPSHAVSTIRGLLWNFVHIRVSWKKRLAVQKFVRKLPDKSLQELIVKPSVLRLLSDFRRHYPKTSL